MTIPPVTISTHHDINHQITSIRSSQQWHKDGKYIQCAFDFPIADGAHTMIDEPIAKAYVTEWMNMHARRLLNDGWAAHVPTPIKEVMLFEDDAK